MKRGLKVHYRPPQHTRQLTRSMKRGLKDEIRKPREPKLVSDLNEKRIESWKR